MVDEDLDGLRRSLAMSPSLPASLVEPLIEELERLRHTLDTAEGWWPGRGAQVIRALFAEHMVAELLWPDDHDTVWRGGNGAAWDVQGAGRRIDAKLAWREGGAWTGYIGFGRPEAIPFQPDRVDALALVEWPTLDTSWELLPDGRSRLVAIAGPTPTYVVPVAEINAHIRRISAVKSGVPFTVVEQYKRDLPTSQPKSTNAE